MRPSGTIITAIRTVVSPVTTLTSTTAPATKPATAVPHRPPPVRVRTSAPSGRLSSRRGATLSGGTGFSSR